MRGDHGIVAEACITYACIAQRVNEALGIVGADRRRAVEETLQRLSYRRDRKRAAKKTQSFARARADRDGTVTQSKHDALAVRKRRNLFDEPYDLRRIRRRLVTLIPSLKRLAFIEERQVRRRLQFREQRLELQFAVKAVEIGVGRRGVTALLPIDGNRKVAAHH